MMKLAWSPQGDCNANTILLWENRRNTKGRKHGILASYICKLVLFTTLPINFHSVIPEPRSM